MQHARSACGNLFQAQGGVGREAMWIGRDQVDAVVVGVGLNVNVTAASLPQALEGQATSLRIASGGSVDRLTLLTHCNDALNGLDN